MPEPTRDQIAKDYALALTIIDRLRRERDELLACLKEVRRVALAPEFLVVIENPAMIVAVDRVIAKADGR